MPVTVADLLVKLSSDFDDRGVKQAQRSVGGLGGMLKTALGTGAGFLLAEGVNAAVRGVSALGGAALDFEASMANVDSIAQLTRGELNQLKDDVVGIATDPRIAAGPAELASGLYDVQSSGFAGADALKILSSSSMAATAGLTETDVAARAATGVLNAYGLGADQVNRVNDVMFQTVNDGVITYDQLANNMGNVIPVAAGLGISIEEVGAAYAQMTLSNVNASAAETQIAALMRSALNPTQALTTAVQKHGYASAEALIAAEGMPGYLALLQEESGGSSEALMDMLGTQEAMNAATILGKGDVKDYNAELAKQKKASEGVGATQRALERQMRSTNYQFGQIKKNIETGAVVVMDLFGGSLAGVAGKIADLTAGGVDFLRYLDDVMEGGSRVGELMEKIPEPLQRTARAFALVADAVGDTIRAFREGGLQGAIDELARIQGDRILGGLRVLGEEAWGAFKEGLEGAARVAAFALDVTVDIGKWVLGKVPSLVDWLDTLFGGSGATRDAMPLGDATGGPEPGALRHVTIGQLLVDIGGWALGKVADLWGWLQGQIGVRGKVPTGDGTGGPETDAAPVTLSDVLVDVLGWAAGEIADLGGWIQEQIDNLAPGLKAEIDQWTLILFPPDKVTPPDKGQTESKVQEEFDLWGFLKVRVPYEIDLFFNRDLPEMARSLEDAHNKIQSTIDILLNGRKDAIKVPFTNWSLDIHGLRDVDWAGGFTDNSLVNLIQDLIPDDLHVRMPDWTLEVDLPATVDFIGDIGASIQEKIKDKLKGFLLPISVGAEEGGTGAATLTLDVSGAQRSLEELKASLQDWSAAKWEADLTLSSSLGTGVLNDFVSDLETGWETDVFTSQLDLDIGPAAIQYTGAWAMGQAWDDHTFTSGFDADITAVGTKYVAAWAMGDAWAGASFTSTFDLDIGPALAAIAELNRYLPHSPAEKGPLAEPVSFDHIPAAFARSFDRMAGMVPALGFGGGGQGWTSGAATARGRRRGGDVFIIALRPDEWVTYAQKAERGALLYDELPRELIMMGAG